MLHADFLYKNRYRKYPLKATSNKTEQGRVIPTALFVGARISTIAAYSHVYISKIVIKGSFINVTLMAEDITLGYCEGNILQANTVLQVLPAQPFSGGVLVIGDPSCLKDFQGRHTLTFSSGELEESLVNCFTRPAVTSIKVGSTSLTGKITLGLSNLSLSDSLQLSVTNPSLVMSNIDKCSSALNCPTHVVTGINTVKPDSWGNIDVYAVAPLTIQAIDHGISLDSPTIQEKDLCPKENIYIPRLAAINDYKGYRPVGDPERNILLTSTPEYKDTYQTSSATLQGKGRVTV